MLFPRASVPVHTSSILVPMNTPRITMASESRVARVLLNGAISCSYFVAYFSTTNRHQRTNKDDWADSVSGFFWGLNFVRDVLLWLKRRILLEDWVSSKFIPILVSWLWVLVFDWIPVLQPNDFEEFHLFGWRTEMQLTATRRVS